MPVTVPDVVAAVARETNVSADAIMGYSRKKRIVRARWECWKRLAALGWSSTRLGQVWGRDHSTVVHAVNMMGGQFNRFRARPMPKMDENEARRALMIKAYWAERGVDIKTRFEAFGTDKGFMPAVRSEGIPVRGA
jgi:hypothetical protein